MPTHLPRPSLSSQAATVLRAEIEAGAWGERLPGERLLAERLGVSRPTLRAALDSLAGEGWLKRRQGLPTRVLRGGSTTAERAAVVRVLTPVPLREMPPLTVCWLDELRERLGTAGHSLELVVRPVPSNGRAGRVLAHLERSHPGGVWILHLAPEALQRAFAARGLPALIAGSAAAGVALPSVDLDYRAVCRHAAGLLRAKGRRRPVLLLPDTAAPGDAESAQGFLEGFPGARVLRHDGTAAGLCHQVRNACGGRQGADAFVVGRSAHALTVLTHLLGEGQRVPRDVSLIARDGDAFLAHAVPAPARYASDPRSWAATVTRLVLRLAEGVRTRSQHRLMPDFVAGGTL
jgi:LacI family transcriptional regulator